MSLIIPLIIGLISIIAPGFFLALALLKKTDLPMFEIAVIGFIFGMIFPPALTWLEGYLIPISPIFAFSNGLYNANVIILTIIGILASFQQGAFSSSQFDFLTNSKLSIKQQVEKDYKKRVASLRRTIAELNTDLRVIKEHEKEEAALIKRHGEELELMSNAGAEERRKIVELHTEQERKLFEQHEAEEKQLLSATPAAAEQKPGISKSNVIWLALIIIMLLTFATRMLSISVAPTYFEFDPYFDMLSTQAVLTYGQQLLYEHAAWPSLVNGTIGRIQPLVPYMEAYWYNLAGATPSSTTINTTLLSLVSSWYPPITAALLVFAVFMFIYHEYGEYPAIIGAGLAAAMPVLITTFIAGEQLLEPWGIFAMFFFYAAYLLAVNNPEEKRFAILAGIAFASNFLGAHYYTVPAGVLSFYILLQGVIHILRKEDTKSFYKMNIIVLAVIAIFYAAYGPYGSALNASTPTLLGIPVIVSFPIAALALVAFLEYIPKLIKGAQKVDIMLYIEWFVAVGVITLLLVIFTPLGNPFRKYIALSTHFTTPSSPLFMTVQEYALTGINYDFGSGGFGIIGSTIAGVNIIVWAVMIAFTILTIVAIKNRKSNTSVLTLAMVWPLAVAGMIEVKYLPHFGVGYIIAICAILGELMLYYSKDWSEFTKKALMAAFAVILLLEAIGPAYQLLTAAANSNCNSISNQSNTLGAVLYCNTVPQYWLAATDWMKTNVGPYAPRILSWWDYGDWINWFGNSNAVLRGDNSVAAADYAAAAHYIFTPNDTFNSVTYNSAQLGSYMDSVQAKYILFDDQLVPKWGALDFLGCTYVNQTGLQYALAAGQQNGEVFALGTSPCEIKHDPAYLLIPIPTSGSISDYCTFSSNSTEVALKGIVLIGNSASNVSYCIPQTFLQNGNPTYLLSPNGSKTNALISTAYYGGSLTSGGTQFVSFMIIYAPNGPNDTITDAPSEFYGSTYYRGFFLGKLPGLTRVYPSNFTGINFINSTSRVMIFELNNYTGSLPEVVPKPSWIKNNYTIPG